MNRHRIVVSIAIALAVAAAAGIARADVKVSAKEGACKLREAGAFDEEKLFKVRLGHDVKVECRLRIDEFFGKKIINANAEVKNTAKKAMHYQYYIAFFTKEMKLVGCAAQGSFGDDGLAAGEETQFGSCLIELPHSAVGHVTHYKAVFYESDEPIGKK